VSRGGNQHVEGHVEGVIYFARVPHKELHSVLQLCEALYICPFFLISNEHAHVAAPFLAKVESKAFDFMQFMHVIVSAVAIATGVSSSTWTKRRSIFQ